MLTSANQCYGHAAVGDCVRGRGRARARQCVLRRVLGGLQPAVPGPGVRPQQPRVLGLQRGAGVHPGPAR